MIPAPLDQEYSIISLDLSNERMAIDLASKIAAQTGCAVTVRDAEGAIIAIMPAATKNSTPTNFPV